MRRAALLTAVLLVALPILAPFSSLGTRLVVYTLGAVTPIEVKYGAGTLASGLQLAELRVLQDDVTVEMDSVAASLAYSCLWQGEICIEHLQIQRLSIAVNSTADVAESDADAPAQEMFEFPLPVQAPAITIGEVAITWDGGAWHSGAVSGWVDIRGSDIRVSKTQMRDALLSVVADETTDNTTANTAFAPPQIALPLRLIIDDLVLTGPRWDIGNAAFQHDELRLQGSWNGTEINLQHLSLATPQWGNVAVEGQVHFDGNWPLQLAAKAEVDQPPIWAHLHDRTVQLQLAGDLQALEIAASSSGAQTLQLNATLDALAENLPFSLTAALGFDAKLALGTLPDMPAALAAVTVESPVKLTAQGTLQQQAFVLEGTFSGASYSGISMTLRGQHQTGQLTVEQLVLSDETSDSNLLATGSLSYQQGLAGNFQLSSPGFELPAVNPQLHGRISGGLQVQGKWQEEEWQLALQQVELSGMVNELPANVTGDLILAAGLPVREAQLLVAVNGAKFSLKSLPDDPEHSHLSLHVDDLSRWEAGSHGRFEVTADLNQRQQSLVFSGSASQVIWRDVSVTKAQLQGSAALQGSREFSISVDTKDTLLGEIALAQLKLTLSGDEKNQSAILLSRGDIDTQLQIQGEQHNDQWLGDLQPARVQTPFGVWQLANRVPLEWDHQSRDLRVAAHCWRTAEASLCAAKPLQLGATGAAKLALDGDLGMFQLLLPAQTQIEGEITASLQTSWDSHAKLLLRVDSEFSDGTFTRHYDRSESLSMSWGQGQLSLANDGDGFRLQSNLLGSNGGRLIADIGLPDARDQALSGSVELTDMQLVTFQPLLPALSHLEGLINGQLTLDGTLDSPTAAGALQLDGGRLAIDEIPTELSELTLALRFQGNRGNITGTGLMGGGDLTLSGELLLDPELQLRLDLTGDRQRILLPPYSDAEISHELQLTATTEHLQLRGAVEVHSGLIQAEQLPEGSVKVSSDAVLVDVAGNVIQEKNPFDTSIDIRLTIDDQLYLRTQEIYANASGKLHLVQEDDKPLQLFGNLKVLGGNIEAYGQRLEIKAGTVGFVGEPDNPDLNLRAERNISREQLRVGITVKGSVAEPILEVYSEPTLSPAEALSYLTKGKGLDAGTAGDGAAVALSLGTGAMNRSGVLSGINKMDGFRNVEFGSEGSAEDTAATIGGYIGESIYLSYGVGIYDPITVLTARFYLLSNLWLEVVSRLENSVDIYYNFTID